MRRVLTLLMMMTLTLISSTSIAAAMCRHQSTQMHAAALDHSDRHVAAEAQLEDSAGSMAAKRGMLADAGAFSLPAFIIPAPLGAVPLPAEDPMRLRAAEAERVTGLSIAPLLHPPAA